MSPDDVFEMILGTRRLLKSMIVSIYQQEMENLRQDLTFHESLLKTTKDPDYSQYLTKEIRFIRMHLHAIQSTVLVDPM